MTEVRYYLLKRHFIYTFRQISTVIESGKRHRLPYLRNE
jgi:hypothetical protein